MWKHSVTKLEILKASYRDIASSRKELTTSNISEKYFAYCVSLRDEMIAVQADSTIMHVPQERLIRLLPAVLNMLSELGHHWEEPEEKPSDDEMAIACSFGLAILRYENRLAKSLVAEPYINDAEIEEFLEKHSWRVGKNPNQLALPF